MQSGNMFCINAKQNFFDTAPERGVRQRVVAGGAIGAYPVSPQIPVPAPTDSARFLGLPWATKGRVAIYRTQKRRRPRAMFHEIKAGLASIRDCVHMRRDTPSHVA